MLITKAQWDEFYSLISCISKEVLARVAAHVEANKYVSTYRSYPQSVSDKSIGGWPNVNEVNPYTGLLFDKHRYEFSDFSSLCTIQKADDRICIFELEGYQTCAQFLSENSNLLPLIWYKEAAEHIGLALCLLIGDIVNRYIAQTGQYDYNDQTFKDIYTSIMNLYFLKRLDFDICVPVLFVEFESDYINVDDNIYITKMTDDFIRSKHFIGGYDAYFEKLVLNCATHMIVIKGYSLQNCDFISSDILRNQRAYPINIIDLIFASIRIVAEIPTGYAQIVARPTNNWIPRQCKGDLIGLTGAKAREYPDFFLEHFWLEPHNSLSSEQETKIVSLASSLLKSNQNAYSLACSRLNSSMLRNCEEDAVLDAIIGLELLMSDNDKGELTYKIASRMATLSTLLADCPYTPIDVQQSVTKLYRYRSDIIHSRTPKPSTKLIKVSLQREVEAVSLAIKFLSMAIEILAVNPKYLSPKRIDELMMKKLQYSRFQIPFEV